MSTRDADICGRVLKRLQSIPELSDAELAVAVREHVVTLCGWVQDYDHKVLAETAVSQTDGVAAVAVEVAVRGPYPRRQTDTDTAHLVARYLGQGGGAPVSGIRARVERAWVTLEGTVDLFHQREELEEGVKSIAGVQGVINLVGVRPPEAQSDIDAKVETAVAGDIAGLDPAGAKARRRDAMEEGRKILIVDDDDDFRDTVRRVLEGEGYTVVEASSGRQGLERLIEHEPDVVVVDIMMESNAEGYGFTQAVKHQDAYRRFRATPVVMVSSIQETPDERFPMAPELELIQPDAYLTKPLDFDRFVEVVRKASSRARSGRS